MTFKLGTDSDMAQVLVQNRVSLALPVIPRLVQNEGINVRKMSPNTLMIVNLISPDGRYDDIFLSNYATIYVKDELGRLPGVAGITYLGQRDYSLRAWLDPDKLAALNSARWMLLRPSISRTYRSPPDRSASSRRRRGQQFQLTINTLGRLITPSNSPTSSSRPARATPRRTPAQAASAARAHQCRQRQHQGARNAAIDRHCPPADVVTQTRWWPRVELGSQQYDQSCTLDGKPSVALSDLSTARLQCSGYLQRHLRQDEGAKGALPRRARLPDRL